MSAHDTCLPLALVPPRAPPRLRRQHRRPVRHPLHGLPRLVVGSGAIVSDTIRRRIQASRASLYAAQLISLARCTESANLRSADRRMQDIAEADRREAREAGERLEETLDTSQSLEAIREQLPGLHPLVAPETLRAWAAAWMMYAGRVDP